MLLPCNLHAFKNNVKTTRTRFCTRKAIRKRHFYEVYIIKYEITSFCFCGDIALHKIKKTPLNKKGVLLPKGLSSGVKVNSQQC